MVDVLLVEPDKLLASTYRRALVHAGYTVTHVTSGQDAVDTADAVTPKLILLELQLPAHNGLEFLYELRSYREWQTIPVIVNTLIPPDELGWAIESLKRELGVKAWHYKPQTDIQALLRSIALQSGEN
jgi:DNA-binding response OmpR family regulator